MCKYFYFNLQENKTCQEVPTLVAPNTASHSRVKKYWLPDSSDRLCRSHIMQYSRSYRKLE